MHTENQTAGWRCKADNQGINKSTALQFVQSNFLAWQLLKSL